MAYAIWNRKYKKWLQGTDFGCCPRRQILSEDTPKLWEDYDYAELSYRQRHCGKEYEIVQVKIVKEQEHE